MLTAAVDISPSFLELAPLRGRGRRGGEAGEEPTECDARGIERGQQGDRALPWGSAAARWPPFVGMGSAVARRNVPVRRGD